MTRYKMFYVSHDNHKAKNLTRFPKDRDGEEEHNSGKPPSHKGTQQESKSNKGTTK